ncbi:EF-hand domain containing protein [Novymonas esmeraldas]|uniref:EF-hand domain containing protein n=1 Tax=Novymonas esmeraldas TaxID=1808958 RepID=A0AAW0F4R2_9TRYP
MGRKSKGKGGASVVVTMPRTSHDKVAELKEAFFILDSSGSGAVSAAEIKTLLSSVLSGRMGETFDSFLEECHVNANESITFAQFFVLVTRLHNASVSTADGSEDDLPAADMCAAFAPFDPDDTGVVDSNVFFALLGEKEDKLTSEEQEDLRLRLERTGHMKKGRVHYRAFINNLVATSVSTPYF